MDYQPRPGGQGWVPTLTSIGWVPTVNVSRPVVGGHPEWMPSRGTPKITLRVSEELWQRFGEVAHAAETDRATLLRAFIVWYVGRGKLPKPPS
jgi:hypothetical protein